MAVQIPDPGTGNGQTGDNEYVFRKKVKDNFSDQTNAASRLLGTGAEQIPLSKNIPSLLGTAATRDVGRAAGNVLERGAFGLGDPSIWSQAGSDLVEFNGYRTFDTEITGLPAKTIGNAIVWASGGGGRRAHALVCNVDEWYFLRWGTATLPVKTIKIYTTGNTTKDANGFLKGASPVVDLYDDMIELNQDAEQQGGITFEKLGVGDYLVKGSLGFAQEGWHIETPKDTNGNVLVAVVETQLENNDLSIKTYAKRFDDETGDIVANLAKPRDIPAGRFISLRLHELPKEPPVMPTEPTTEI